MTSKRNALLVTAIECFANLTRKMKLGLEPERHRHQERLKSRRCERYICLQQAVKFQERLVVENHIVELFRSELAFLETVIHGVLGEFVIVLDPGKTFL